MKFTSFFFESCVMVAEGQLAFVLKLQTHTYIDSDKGGEVPAYKSVTVLTEKGKVVSFQDYDPGNTIAPRFWTLPEVQFIFSWQAPEEIPESREWIPC